MRLNEFGNDHAHYTIEDVQQDHPEIYAFMKEQVGHLALEQQTIVDMFDMSSAHHVVLIIKPALSLNSTEIMLQRRNVDYERTKMASGDMLSGSLPFGNFRVTNDDKYGNKTERWDFEIPNSEK